MSPETAGLPSVTSLTDEDAALLLGLPAYRIRQIRKWIERGVHDFAQMTDLSLSLRESLPSRVRVLSSLVTEVSRSPDGTRKILVGMEDGEPVECVLIPTRDRMTLCMSSQVGCAAKCAFCASGMLGFTRHLKPHEIYEQYLHASRIAGGEEKITNIVMMGMGEPLLNYDSLVAAIRLLPLSRRRITVSTVGLPDRIRKLSREGLKVGLAVSLHAASDKIRNRLVPVNKKFGVVEVVRAAREYFETTGRDVTFEYILIEGENASDEDARKLAQILRGGNLNVNLIPMNPVEGLPFRPPPTYRVDAFQRILDTAGIPTHVRRPRGREIDAACGQLRLKRLQEG